MGVALILYSFLIVVFFNIKIEGAEKKASVYKRLIGVLIVLNLTLPTLMPKNIPAFIPMVEKVLGKESYRNIGIGVIIVLTIAFLYTSIAYYLSETKRIKQDSPFRQDLFLGFLLIQFLIIHPLVFYIHWGTHSNFRGDGQIIFGIVETFPTSSVAFVLLGLLTELVRYKDKTTAPNAS